MFLKRSGAISCVVMGTRRYYDSPQGGMEIPCHLKFSSDDSKSLQKIRKLAAEDLEDRNPAKPALDPPKPSCRASADLESSTSSSDGSVSMQNTLSLLANNDTEIWLQYHCKWLNLNDKIILQRRDELSDKYIQSAQKEQFPSIGRLFSTLLQERCYSLHNGSVQIIHCFSRHHWIAVSNVGCSENIVNVYDFLFPDVDATTCALIKNMFGGHECEMSMKKGKCNLV